MRFVFNGHISKGIWRAQTLTYMMSFLFAQHVNLSIRNKENSMRKYLTVLLLTIFIIPSIALASWYNPFSWFKKTVTSPVVQVSVPISNQILPKSAGCHSDKGFNSITGAPCGSTTISTITTKPTPKQNTTTTSTLKTTSPSVVAIDSFLANPTAENLKTFCTTAKTLPGIGEKKVFNDTRTDYVTKKNTLYDETDICALALGEYKTPSGFLVNVSWIAYNPLDIFDFNNASESDKVRAAKITYNNYWKSLAKYKLIGFRYSPDSEIITPKQDLQNAINSNNNFGLLIHENRSISQMFVVPEQVLSEVRLKLINN